MIMVDVCCDNPTYYNNNWLMNYLNKLVNNVTNAPNQDELRNDLKRREQQLAKLQDKVKTLTEEKEFGTQAYVEL